MPDLTLTFSNTIPFDDVSFHPCVRHSRYDQSKVVSFIPPDGNFKLMNYRVTGQLQIPVYVKPQITMGQSSGKITLLAGSKFTDSKRILEDVVVLVPLTKAISNATVTVNMGKASFDEQTRVLKWYIGKLSVKQTTPQLDGTLVYSTVNTPPEVIPPVQVEWRMNLHSASNLSVASLTVQQVSYKPFKGFKAITKSGKFFVKP